MGIKFNWNLFDKLLWPFITTSDINFPLSTCVSSSPFVMAVIPSKFFPLLCEKAHFLFYLNRQCVEILFINTFRLLYNISSMLRGHFIARSDAGNNWMYDSMEK